jgi:protein O-GlcNAc transferase
MTIQQALDMARQHHQAGRLTEAEVIYRQILDREPNHDDVLHLLGVIAHQVGNNQLAVDLINRAIALNSTAAIYHNNLGLALMGQNQTTAAIAAYQAALQLKPDYAYAHNNLGFALEADGQVDAAIAACQQALRIKPDYPDAFNNLGNTFKAQGRGAAAANAYQEALRLNPGYADAWSNLGNLLHDQGQFDQAVAACRQAIRLKPTFAQAWNNLGNALKDQGQIDAAMAAYQTALKFKPNQAEVYNNLGVALNENQTPDAAIAACQQALRIKPDYLEAYNNLGVIYKDIGRLDAALEAFGTALQFKPDYLGAHSNLVYTLHYHPDIDDKTIHQEHLRWNARHAMPLRKSIQPHTPPDSHRDDPERRLKVGYVSPDFYSHAESHFVTPLLEAHDHRQFEIHCYASVMRPDHITERLRRGVDVWHNVLGKSDADLAQQIREDQIDILVDLTMHMANNRLLVFAQKPAPVQVTWLAYPGSTGLDTIDYRLTDAFMDPPGVATPYFTEEAVRLPDCWCCYDPLSDAAPKPPRQDGPICFGSLNNPCKLNDQVLNLWGKVLEATPDSRLLILTFSVEHQKHMRQLYERMGIESQRLIFVKRCPREQYLRLYDRIDIGLDPLPYNGITTTLDALWMGVPVISLAGSTAAGRAGLGILSTLGLPELVVQTPEQYVEIAVKLAGDLPGLKELRSTLRQRMQASPLMDAKRFARNVESAYHTMWRKWCSGCAEKVES